MLRYLFLPLVTLLLFAELPGQIGAPENAWQALVREDPDSADDPGINWRERLILHALTPEQARAYHSGVPADRLFLADGRTLDEYLRDRLAPVESVYVSLPTPCRIFNLDLSPEEGLRILRVGRLSLLLQGGSDAGCMVPDEALALMLQVRAVQLKGVAGRVKLWSADTPEPALGVLETELSGKVSQTTVIVPVCLQECCGEVGLKIRVLEDSAVEAEVLGYFRSPRVSDEPVYRYPLAFSGTNTYDGENALASSTGNNNSAFGYHALSNGTSGVQNTAVGSLALEANSTGNYNTAVGVSALSSNAGGHYNTALGRESLKANTSGFENTALGQQAMLKNMDGYRNTAIGDDSMAGNLGGDLNTAVGEESLKTNETGNSNTAIGQAAMKSNYSGSDNTAVGQEALYSNSVGSMNTAVGRQAGRDATGQRNSFFGRVAGYGGTASIYNSADFNSYFGDSAGYFNTSGGYNAYFGYAAGYFTTSGNHNVFIGSESGYTNGDGKDNVFMGASAGYDNLSGGGNVFVGRNAGISNKTGSSNTLLGRGAGEDNTVEDRNTMIGAHTDLDPGPDPKTSPVTNATAVGYRAYVSQSNSLVLGSIEGINSASDSVKVGIGTSAPSAPLHIQTMIPSGPQLTVVDDATGGYFSVVDGKDVPYFPLFWFSGKGVNGNGGGLVAELPTTNDVYSGSEKAAVVLEGRRSDGTNLVNTNILAVRNKWTPALWLTAGGDLYTTGSITPGSSRDLKEEIEDLGLSEALETLAGLHPVTFRYKADREKDLKAGFIAEDVPEMVATPDRRGVSSMDIVAVITRVLQHQREEISRLKMQLAEVRELATRLAFARARENDR